MTTAQLAILCLTALVAITVVSIVRSRAVADDTTRSVYASGEMKAAALALAEAAALLADPVAELKTTNMALRGLMQMHEQAPRRTNHRVTVHTKKPDDQTIFGLVVYDGIDRISLENAEYVSADGVTPMKGRQDIAKSDVAWIDVHQLVVAAAKDCADTGGDVVAIREAS